MRRCNGDRHWISDGNLCPFCFRRRGAEIGVGEITHEEYLVYRYPYLREEVERLSAIQVPWGFMA